jgi:ligand-binding sensor protein
MKISHFEQTLETLSHANELATKVIASIAGEEISTHVNHTHYTHNVLRQTIAAGMQKALTHQPLNASKP